MEERSGDFGWQIAFGCEERLRKTGCCAIQIYSKSLIGKEPNAADV